MKVVLPELLCRRLRPAGAGRRLAHSLLARCPGTHSWGVYVTAKLGLVGEGDVRHPQAGEAVDDGGHAPSRRSWRIGGRQRGP